MVLVIGSKTYAFERNWAVQTATKWKCNSQCKLDC